jgi:hypothetical protein
MGRSFVWMHVASKSQEHDIWVLPSRMHQVILAREGSLNFAYEGSQDGGTQVNVQVQVNDAGG